MVKLLTQRLDWSIANDYTNQILFVIKSFPSSGKKRNRGGGVETHVVRIVIFLIMQPIQTPFVRNFNQWWQKINQIRYE